MVMPGLENRELICAQLVRLASDEVLRARCHTCQNIYQKSEEIGKLLCFLDQQGVPQKSANSFKASPVHRLVPWIQPEHGYEQ